MKWHKDTLEINTRGKGLYPFTEVVERRLQAWGVREGMVYLYLQHTSASLLISENYDPTARRDLEAFMERLAPEGQAWHQHTLEGTDDSPSHMRAMLTNSDLAIPVDEGRMSLGTWQGIYLFEHRRSAERRRVLLRFLSVVE
ncbi:MAG: secondary thiamine-phosphate synthase enzyme YjbQ [Chloroflexota bacterium]